MRICNFYFNIDSYTFDTRNNIIQKPVRENNAKIKIITIIVIIIIRRTRVITQTVGFQFITAVESNSYLFIYIRIYSYIQSNKRLKN